MKNTAEILGSVEVKMLVRSVLTKKDDKASTDTDTTVNANAFSDRKKKDQTSKANFSITA